MVYLYIYSLEGSGRLYSFFLCEKLGNRAPSSSCCFALAFTPSMAMASSDLASPDDDDGEDDSPRRFFGTPLSDLPRTSISSPPPDFPPHLPRRLDPASPRITCLGQVRLAHPPSHSTPPASSHQTFKPAKPRFPKRNPIRGTQIPHHILQLRQNCCWRFSFSPPLSSTRQQEPPSASPVAAEITRRERLAILIYDLHAALEKNSADQSYVPSVPPPNSLLLMRGFRRPNPVDAYAINGFGGDENFIPKANRENICGEILGAGSKMMVSSFTDGNCNAPFSNRTNTAAPKAALWERRSIPKLADVDVKKNVA